MNDKFWSQLRKLSVFILFQNQFKRASTSRSRHFTKCALNTAMLHNISELLSAVKSFTMAEGGEAFRPRWEERWGIQTHCNANNKTIMSITSFQSAAMVIILKSRVNLGFLWRFPIILISLLVWILQGRVDCTWCVSSFNGLITIHTEGIDFDSLTLIPRVVSTR